MSEHNENEREDYVGKAYKDYSKPRPDYTPEETVKDVRYYEAVDWPERGLRKETLERFGVKMKTSEEFGPSTIDKIYFPYYNQTGKLVGYKVKNLTKDKSEKGHFYSIGHVGVDCQLFGQNKARKKAKFIFATEGEVDMLSTFQALVDYQRGPDQNPKFKDLMPAVISIGCGTVNAVEHMANNAKFIGNYGELRLCFDNDCLSEMDLKKPNPGMRGRETTEAVGNHFMQMLVRVADWPEWVNDPSDYLQKDKSEELAKTVLFKCSEYNTEKIVGLYDKFKSGDLFQPLTQGVYLPGFPKLMEKLLGIRPGELTLMMAASGIGKSSISAEIAYNYAAQEGGVGGIFLEEGMKKTCNRFIARRLEVHPNLYKWNPDQHCTYEEYLEAEKWVADPNNLLFLDHFGVIKIENLIDLAKILIFKYHRKFIVLDHISLTVGGDGDIDERVELEKAMIQLAALCENSDVHIIVVSHINRAASTTTSKERDFTEPKWKRTFITDGKGTQALEALAWNIILIDGELLPDGTRGRIRINLGKNREADELGFCDISRMDDKTGVFYDASHEVWHPETDGYGGDD